MTFPTCLGIELLFHMFPKFLDETNCRVELLEVFPFVLRFHRFHVSEAAVRPALVPFLLCGCCVPEYTDACFLFPFLLVTLADTVRSMDVLALYVFVSRDLGRFRITCHRPAYSYVSHSPFT